MFKKLFLMLYLICLMLFVGCRNESDFVGNSYSTSVDSSVLSSENTVYINNSEQSAVENITGIAETATESHMESEEPFDSTVSEVSSETVAVNDTQSIVSTESKLEETESTVSETTQIQNATPTDAKEIATLVAQYINEQRNMSGVSGATVLSGLTEYAEYRSRQIVLNFAHDTNDERAAATALKYGKYIDPTIYGVEGEAFYSACASEAIVKTDYMSSKELVAKFIVRLVVNSQEHWSYVGNPENNYIAVGVTYENGFWFCDIAVSNINYG